METFFQSVKNIDICFRNMVVIRWSAIVAAVALCKLMFSSHRITRFMFILLCENMHKVRGA